MYKIQNIIIPDRIDGTYNMYIRKYDGIVNINNTNTIEKYISFDTYFNSFSLKKWNTYTVLSDIKLVIKASGNFTVEICELYRDNTDHIIISKNIDSKNIVETVIDIPQSHAQMIFFRIRSHEDINIEEAYYATDTPPCQDIHLDIVICTFKKEKYIYNNLEKFNNLFKNNNLHDKLFINIVDNGRSLDINKINCPNIQIYPNINTGGAGGFARGMIEVLRSARKTTHILLMDDDIEIIPQSILLTISFLCYIKIEYRKHFIGGAMLNIMYKNIKTASLEWFITSKTKIRSIGEQNLNFRNDILISDFNSVRKNQYQAWWYCVVPMAIINGNNLPYPLFFRHDDIDFSFRNHAKIILINGICVWHEPFYKKRTIFPDYIQLRNMLALSASDKHLSEKSIFFTIWHHFLNEVRTLNYKGAQAYPDAIEHVCQGPEFFMNPENCALALKNGLSRNEKLIPINQIEGGSEFMDYYEFMGGRIHGFKKIIWEFTLNGHFLPNCLLKTKRGIGGHADYAPDKFYLRPSMVVIDPVNGTAAIRNRSKKDFWKVFLRMVRATLVYYIRRKYLRNEYRKKYSYMTSIEFWEKYLDLDHNSEKQ